MNGVKYGRFPASQIGWICRRPSTQIRIARFSGFHGTPPTNRKIYVPAVLIGPCGDKLCAHRCGAHTPENRKIYVPTILIGPRGDKLGAYRCGPTWIFFLLEKEAHMDIEE